MDSDPDPGGPKTYGCDGSGFGSGSATLVFKYGTGTGMLLVVKEFCAGSYLPEEEDEHYLAFIMIEACSGKTVHLIKTGLKFSLFQVSIESLPYDVLEPYLWDPRTHTVPEP
jgi:hypothetical protein